MFWSHTIQNSKIIKAAIIGLSLSSILIFQGCYKQSLATKVGSHQVKIERESFVKRFGVTEKDGNTIFQYEGYCKTGQYMKVMIYNEVVSIDGKVLGRLREGDSVIVHEDGVTVNSMDYGESEKYLKANGGQTTAAL
ncbi:MAG TPA: hypothetical protein VGB17_17240 [Pyrinomonadaceae bacterium]|jgi:hypothetical protein